MMVARVPVIINASSGAPKISRWSADLADRFKSAGFQASIRLVNSAEITAEVQSAVAAKPEMIVIGGGDGTLSAAASSLIGTDTALGILPLGTLNHFAKDLGVPLEIGEAVRSIVANHQAEIDVGEVNGRVFVNNSSLGLYPTLIIARERQRRRLGRGRWHAFFWALLTVLKRHPMLDVRFTLDEAVQDRRTPFVFIGNNAYQSEGFDVGTRARLDAGVLSVYLTRRRGRRGLLGLALRSLMGLLHGTRDFESLTAQSITIATRHKTLPVATDGEVNVMRTPLEYKIRPRGLRVVVPAPAPD